MHEETEAFDPINGDDVFLWTTKNRQGSKYSQSRQAFLSSYHFSVEEKEKEMGMKQRLRRSVKEMNQATMGAVVEFGREVVRRRRGFRGFRVRFSLSSLDLVRCYVPWFTKMDRELGR